MMEGGGGVQVYVPDRRLPAGDSAERPCFSLLRELHEKLLGRTLDKHEFLQDEVKCLTRVEIR